MPFLKSSEVKNEREKQFIDDQAMKNEGLLSLSEDELLYKPRDKQRKYKQII